MTTQDSDDWIGSREAAAILSQHCGHPVSPRYVHDLAVRHSLIRYRYMTVLGRRLIGYSRADIEAYTVKRRGWTKGTHGLTRRRPLVDHQHTNHVQARCRRRHLSFVDVPKPDVDRDKCT